MKVDPEGVVRERLRLEMDYVRHLKWELKRANKERGKQGQEIFRLRGENALLRERIRKLQATSSVLDIPLPITNGVEPSKIEGFV